MPRLGEARLVINMDVAADLLVAKGQEGAVIRGIFLKQFNDCVRLALFPRSQILAEDLENMANARTGKIWLLPGKSVDARLVTLTIRDQAQPRRELSIPLLSHELPVTYFNFDCAWSEETSDLLLELENASPIIQFSRDWTNYKTVQLVEGERILTALSPGQCIHLGSLGDSYFFLTVLRCISLSPSPASLSISFSQGCIAISRTNRSLHESKFCLFIHPNPIQRQLGGHRTAGFTPSRFIFAVHIPFTSSGRIYHWLACAITSKLQNPVALPPRNAPRPVVPHLLMLHPKGQGWLLPANASARRHVDKADVLVMFGDIDADFFRGIVETNKYKCIALISDTKDVISRALNPFSPGGLSVLPDTPLWSSYKLTKMVGMFTPDFLAARTSLEELILRIVEETETTGLEIVNQRWRWNIDRRLAALPFCGDLAVGIVCTLGNMLRGRFPDDDGSTTADYSRLLDDGKWMVPWPERIAIERADLIAELNIRIVSEYTAARAFVELCDDCWGTPGNDDTIDMEFIRKLDKELHSWECWGRATDEDKEKTRQNVRNLVKKGEKTPQSVMKSFAHVFYQSSSQLAGQTIRERRREGLSLVNPLVAVYATGGQDNYDLKLDHNSAFWALYAGQLSATKPGAIIPTLLPESDVLQARQLQSALRKSIHAFQDSEKERATICELREKLGSLIRDTVEPALFQILRSLNADRVVSFSDVLLDFLPIEKTILGLEYPTSRYPADTSAYVLVHQIISGFHHVLPPKKGNRVAILCPNEGSDRVSEWAKSLAQNLSDAMKLLGMSTDLPLERFDDVESVLDTATECPIIVFLGHAVASGHWAGLNLGSKWLSNKEVAKKDWSDSFVFLIGCETAALDTSGGDLAKEFLLQGARAVVGTTAKVRVDVAEVFFVHMISELLRQVPADYAFFQARRKSFLYEVLRRKGEEKAASLINRFFESEACFLPCGELLEMFSTRWQEALRISPYSLAFSLLGGAAQTLV